MNTELYSKNPKNLLAETCHFNTQKYKDLFSRAISSRFLYVGYSLIPINSLTKETNYKIVNVSITRTHYTKLYINSVINVVSVIIIIIIIFFLYI